GLSRAGAKVVIADMLDENILYEKAAALTAETGNEAIGQYVNVTDEESVSKMIRNVIERFGTIDVCINSMGINLKRPALEFPMDDWDKMFNVNVKGTMICCKHVGSIMKENKKGSIINLSSVRGIRGYTGGNSAYCGTKGAVELITKTLAIELAPFSVRVNAIGPSLVITQGTIHIQKDLELAEKYKVLIPLGRLAQVEDMVGPVLFLASDASGFVTGQTIFVDGGVTAS
ncbi:MAG: SDR family oxidoreductase, partial [Deltaproteobacteria bacterium]|nr:SDR family oxidoreductase [Deltaproteobacteria bacterium]